MRSVPTLIAFSTLASVLTLSAACGTPANNDGPIWVDPQVSASATAPASPSASPAASTDVSAEPPLAKGKITKSGDICRVIPATAVAAAFGYDTLDSTPYTDLNPIDVDGCTYSHVDPNGRRDLALNVFVRNNPDYVLRQARTVADMQGSEVTKYDIAGSTDSFFAAREGHARFGNQVVSVNFFVGTPDEQKTMSFLARLVAAIG